MAAKVRGRRPARGIIFVDRGSGSLDSYPAITWLLAKRLSPAQWTAQITSPKPGRVSFLIDMLATLWLRRHSYALASIAVFSGHAFSWAEAAAGLLRTLGKPFIAQLHGGGLPGYALRQPRRVQRLLASAAAVTAPSRYLQESMRPFRTDIRLLPNAIDLPSYRSRVRADPTPHMVWLRAFHAVYNPSLALRVLKEIAREHPDSRLTMVGPDSGDGSLQSFLREARDLRLEGRIECTGIVSKNDVPARLNQADVFVNTTNVDNTPVSVIEGLACGLCVVSTNVGGIPYLLKHEHDSLLVPPNDPRAMTLAVRRILAEPGLAETLSRNARRKAERFDWKAVLPQWAEVFQEVLERA